MLSSSWKLFAIIAMVGWGLWGFFGKIAAEEVTGENLLLIGMLANIVLIPLAFILFGNNFVFDWHNSHYYFALATGAIGGVAVLFFYLALRRGEASTVVVISSLYPLITVTLAAIFLHEALTMTKIIGIALALMGVIMLSI